MTLKMNSLGANVLHVVFIIVMCCNSIRAAAIGDSCTPEPAPAGDCTGQNVECIEGTCRCREDYYLDGDNCAPKSNHGGTCSNNNHCGNTLECYIPIPSQPGMCVCQDGNYFNGALPCVSSAPLTPTIQRYTSTLNSITVTWIRQDDPNGYISRYAMRHNGISTEVAVTDNSPVLIQPLNSATTYAIRIIRYISAYGKEQSGISSSSEAFTKSNHGGTCSNNSYCGNSLECYIPTPGQPGTCVCQDGNYYNGALPCVSSAPLKPTILSYTSTYNRITVTWIRQDDPTEYTSRYAVLLNGVSTGVAVTHNSPVLIPSLNSATTSAISIKRYFSAYGKEQNVTSSPYNAATKIVYGSACTENGTCYNNDANCYGRKCLCNTGFYWNTSRCETITNLAPHTITSESVETTSAGIRWVESDKKDFVSGYRVDAVPTHQDDPDPQPVEVTGTYTNLIGLQPGTEYSVTVSAKSTNEERVEYVPANSIRIFTKPVSITGMNEGKSNFTGPDIIIAFNPAVVKYTYYTVRLKGIGSDTYDETLTATKTNNIYRVTFPGVTSGNYYDITVVTFSGSVQSDPFTTRRRVNMAAYASEVQDFTKGAITSRSVYVTWKRPNQPNGILLAYSLEVSKNTNCEFRIVFNCTECAGDRTDDAMPNNCPTVDTININQININDVTHVNEYNITGLDPVTQYHLLAVAYTEEGRGQVPSNDVYVQTEQEAARAPKFIRSTRTTSDTITLMWEPETPRPGITSFDITVHEKIENSERFAVIGNRTVFGYYNQSLVITDLSSYWQYYFSIQAYTMVPPKSPIVISQTVTTNESAPAQVEYISTEQRQGKFSKILVKWECPKQKGGRNGVITSANLTYYSQEEKLPKSTIYVNMKDCMWEEEVDVTPGSNYTFTVYLNNMYHGEERSVYHYIPVGPPLFTQTILKQGSGLKTETSAPLEICPACIHNNNNGKVVKTGLLVCKLGSCPTRIPGETFENDYYDKIPNWDAAKGNGFTSWYRPTSDDWLAGNQDKEKITFILGRETCGLENQNEYCNGPLPVKNTFRVWLFACTSAGCAESDHSEITLGLETEGTLPVSTIAAIACSIAVVIIIIIVVTVVYFKVLKPRSQNKTRTKYKTTTTQDQTHTYDEITGGQRLSVIKDGRQDHDYYNTMASQSDNTYDQLSPYFNTDQHDYGRVNVTQT